MSRRGHGKVAIRAAAAVGPGGSIVGVDVSGPCSIARLKAAPLAVRFSMMDAENLAFRGWFLRCRGVRVRTHVHAAAHRRRRSRTASRRSSGRPRRDRHVRGGGLLSAPRAVPLGPRGRRGPTVGAPPAPMDVARPRAIRGSGAPVWRLVAPARDPGGCGDDAPRGRRLLGPVARICVAVRVAVALSRGLGARPRRPPATVRGSPGPRWSAARYVGSDRYRRARPAASGRDPRIDPHVGPVGVNATPQRSRARSSLDGSASREPGPRSGM